MRARLPVLAALLPALLLTACDAGHRETPGVDNLLASPRVEVLQPRPDAVVAEGPVQVLVRVLGMGDDMEACLQIDDMAPLVGFDPSRPVEVSAKAGSHLLKVWVRGPDGSVVRGRDAVALRHFHLGERTLALGHSPAPGEARVPFDEHQDPVLVWAGPLTPVSSAAAHADLLVLNETLSADGRRLRVRIDGGPDAGGTETLHDALDGPLALEGLAPGTHRVQIDLVEPRRSSEGWRGVRGSQTEVVGELVVR